MSFGTELQGKESHEALLAVQDFELKLLENIKKCITQRIKIDREYSIALNGLAAMASKFDTVEHPTPVYEVWLTVGRETGNLSKMIKDAADKVCVNSLERVHQLICEKRVLRKFYYDERIRLETEFNSLNEEVNRVCCEYNKALSKSQNSRNNYEEFLKKANNKSTSSIQKQEELKGRWVKHETRAHILHNEYTMSILNANFFQRQYCYILLPNLLEFQQNLQILLVSQCKEILLEYILLTNTTSIDYCNLHNNLRKIVSDNIDPREEYRKFIEINKVDPILPKRQEFKRSPSQITSLPTQKLVLDEVTLPVLRQKKLELCNSLDRCNHWLKFKKLELKEMQEKLRSSADGSFNLSYLQQCRHSENLKREVMEQQCIEEKLTFMIDSIRECLGPLADNPDDSTTSTAGGLVVAKLLPENGIDDSIPDDVRMITLDRSIFNVFPSNSTLPSIDSFDDSQSNHSLASSNFHRQLAPGDQLKNKLSNIKSSVMRIKFHKKSSDSTNEINSISPSQKNSIVVIQQQNSLLDKKMTQQDDSVESLDIIQSPVNSVACHESSSTSSNLNKLVDDTFLLKKIERSSSTVLDDAHKACANVDTNCIEKEEYFHGVLPRDEVQRLLVLDGDFLVRASVNRKTGEIQYVLSVMWSGHKHFIIQNAEDSEGGFRFEGSSFPTIPDLVAHQWKSGEVVTRKSEAVLKRPIHKAEWELSNDDIELREKIGSGQFGEVFRGYHMKSGLEVAVKTCRETLTEDMKKKFLMEGRILIRYDHPNIVKLIGIAAQRHPVMIVMEFVEGGSLLSYLRKHRTRILIQTLVKMSADASNGMAYLENKNCLHRDLAARNCLISGDLTLKISDFGMSREEQEYTISAGFKQIPIKWTAPEALNFGTYTWSCDVWSFGILMWEIFSLGETPYPGMTNSQARERVNDNYRMPSPDQCPEACYSLMLHCWNEDSNSRPHFNELHKILSSMVTPAVPPPSPKGLEEDFQCISNA